MMVMRARVEFKHFHQSRQLLSRESLAYFIRNLNAKPANLILVHKAATGIRMTVGKGNIWLYIEYRRTVHQVSATHIDQRPVPVIIIYTVQTHRG